MRPVLVILAAALIIGAAYHAWSSPNLKAETPLLGTQSLKEKLPAKPRCMRPRIFILAQRLPNGKAIPVMTAVVMVPCE